jgi:CRISPR-associated protein Csm4
MNYKIYKLAFSGAVHFGKKSLDDAEYTFCADTLFSALSQEAVKDGTEVLEKLYQFCVEGKLLFSDAFPYIVDTCFLPKPMTHIESDTEKGDSSVKKAYKKLQYIPAKDLAVYLSGKYDALQAPDLGHDLGTADIKVSASIRGEEETKPYRVGTYYFKEGNGLYIIVGYSEDKVLQFAEDLLDRLSYSGIGGKRASGMGRFTLYPGKMPQEIQQRLAGAGSKYMTLSVSLPRTDEIETVLEQAEYLLTKRSGFVGSETYSETQMRKRDLYVLKAGACVRNKYNGDIYDVSDHAGMHPVYRYAKPMFMEVDA